jgi:hypothetical protein
LSDVTGLFRTIETQTSQYIIGSIAVQNYLETQDVHVYVHVDGWVLAYYLKTDPTGKIFDWYSYTGGTTIPTKLEKTLLAVGSAIGAPSPTITFYHFQYPNATNMMLIAEDYQNGNDFTVQLPSSFAYYERSWSLHGKYSNDNHFNLDGQTIKSYAYCDCVDAGTLTASQLSPDTTHTIAVDDDGGLALIYRVP